MYFAQHLKINFGNLHYDKKRNLMCNLRHILTSIVKNIIQLTEIINKHNRYECMINLIKIEKCIQ